MMQLFDCSQDFHLCHFISGYFRAVLFEKRTVYKCIIYLCKKGMNFRNATSSLDRGLSKKGIWFIYGFLRKRESFPGRRRFSGGS